MTPSLHPMEADETTNTTRAQWFLWSVIGLTALAAALRFSTLGLQSYRHDEAVTAGRVLVSSLSGTMHRVWTGESTPPLYYLLAWAWSRLFGVHEVGLRSLSALFGTATVPVAYLAGRELVGRRTGLAIAAMVAVNPVLVWYSQDARAYALLVLLSAAALFFFLRARSGSASDLGLVGGLLGAGAGDPLLRLLPVGDRGGPASRLGPSASPGRLGARRGGRRRPRPVADRAAPGAGLEQRLDRDLPHHPPPARRRRSPSSPAKPACSSTP